ncbi:autoinducer 2 aldolase [miscellaneous Crenarchaeota group-15 archaeon DG-45]|uniref:Autoinducer 2 aldolase n=1 Tax=miscellaneous Crenarchaeota group-15 archaeon DG-45 TaxID=1685127 RepID=A0A0M0BNX6_9ARCH|nr:MAG: autoinducer 2 aldolase [miscellaneous Crenarchaeota group-15 archaeon DG-45]
MDWGMRNRLSRIIKPGTGRSLVLPIDHGYFLGPTRRLEDPWRTVKPLLPYTDALMLTRGILRSSIDADEETPIILRVSGGTSIVGPDLSNEAITTKVQEALRLNASAVSLSIFVGTEHEHQTLTNLARLVDDCEDYGIPVLAVTAVGKELEKRDARYLALCCRIAAELGARFVKTYYCDGFEEVIEGCPVPVLIAGGPRMDTELDALTTAYEAVQAGAVGVVMGRNIWQNDHAVAMVRAVRAVIHEGATPKEAHDLYSRLREES